MVAGSKGWADEGMVCLAALISYGGFFVFHLINSASSDGGWDLFDDTNTLVAVWALVAYAGYEAGNYNKRNSR